MSEPMESEVVRSQSEAVDDRTLMSLIGTAVLALEGVARLEPSLRNLFHARLPGAADGAGRPDGISVTTRGVTTDVTVDLATTAHHRSSDVAATAQQVIRGLLESHDREPGVVAVNVLAIDQAPDAG